MTFLEIYGACLAAIGLVSMLLVMRRPVPHTTRAFKNIKFGELFYDGDIRYKRLRDGDGHNAQRADGNCTTTRFEASDRFDVVTPIELRCAWWRRLLIRYSLGWHFGGMERLSKISWRLSRVLASERSEMAMAAYATKLLMLGDG